MAHSKNFNKVKHYYDIGAWKKKWVWNAIDKWITAEEYFEIVEGEDDE